MIKINYIDIDFGKYKKSSKNLVKISFFKFNFNKKTI